MQHTFVNGAWWSCTHPRIYETQLSLAEIHPAVVSCEINLDVSVVPKHYSMHAIGIATRLVACNAKEDTRTVLHLVYAQL